MPAGSHVSVDCATEINRPPCAGSPFAPRVGWTLFVWPGESRPPRRHRGHWFDRASGLPNENVLHEGVAFDSAPGRTHPDAAGAEIPGRKQGRRRFVDASRQGIARRISGHRGRLPARGGKTFKADRTIHRSPLSGAVVMPGRTRQSREDFSPESSLAEGQRSFERVGSKIFIRRGSDTQKLVE